ncbi:hypothetical protein BANT918_00610 [Brevibacterium antiquum CNRZ 918]|uniref:Uncharacterized protein n=1 Tax=Brevibacterium antiquum CNRZ 918 TaxID=1255637 RepID=A0A2H1I6G5_9MICO|nr:hypothetical protein BANT918_00610 [Brevibacterium antiquum CNRZ 918]
MIRRGTTIHISSICSLPKIPVPKWKAAANWPNRNQKASMSGHVILVDGGFDTLKRGEDIWETA